MINIHVANIHIIALLYYQTKIKMQRKIPLIIDSLSPLELETYRRRICTDIPEYSTMNRNYEIIYRLLDDKPADYVRAIQEREILKTRLKTKDIRTGRVIILRSFTEIWEDPTSKLADEILASSNPLELKWTLAKKYNYKLATTFMPMYAKSIYEYFNAKTVLDPCAGWGDRMVGALSSNCVERYVGFDPNTNLVPGYKQIQKDFGNDVISENSGENHMTFTGSYEIYSLPFELGAKNLENQKFDFAFTSPPFFDYEIYSTENPTYRDWFREFYEPLFILTAKYLCPNGFFAIHIGDTSAGKIQDFLFQRVGQITNFRLKGKIGLVGGQSGKIRDVYLFQLTSNKVIRS